MNKKTINLEYIEIIETKIKELKKVIDRCHYKILCKTAPDDTVLDDVNEAVDIAQDILAANLNILNELSDDVQLKQLRDIIDGLPDDLISVERTDPDVLYTPFIIKLNGEPYMDTCGYESALQRLTCLKDGYELNMSIVDAERTIEEMSSWEKYELYDLEDKQDLSPKVKSELDTLRSLIGKEESIKVGNAGGPDMFMTFVNGNLYSNFMSFNEAESEIRSILTGIEIGKNQEL